MKPDIPTFNINNSFSNFNDSQRGILIADIDDRTKVFERQFFHRHTYYEIFLLKDSTGVHYIDFEGYPFSGTVIFLTAPEQVHKLVRIKGGYGFSIQFEEPFFKKDVDPDSTLYSHFLFDHFQAHPVIPITDDEWNKLKTISEFSLQEYRNNAMGATSLTHAYIRIILMEILRIRKQHFQEGQVKVNVLQQQLLQFKQLLNERYTTCHEVQFYAEKLDMTPRKLNGIVKQFLNKSASQMINERIILEAKRLLAIDISIKETGYHLGFEDPAHFSRFFKQGAGMTAIEFKKSIQNLD